jgi:DNA polymerase elongation subunit (family B)
MTDGDGDDPTQRGLADFGGGGAGDDAPPGDATGSGDERAGTGPSGDADDDGTGAAPDTRPDEEAAAVAGRTDGAVSEVYGEDARFPDPGEEGHVDLLVTQVDYTVERDGSGEYPVVNVFGRTPDDRREHVRVLGVEPYFYVPTAELEGDLTTEYDAIVATREREGDRSFESLRGEALTKVVTRTPRDVGRIRDDFETTFEADILFPNRFLIDNDVRSGIRVPARRLAGSDGDDGDDAAAADGGVAVGAVDGDAAGDVAPPGAPLQVRHDEVTSTTVDARLRTCMFDIEVDDRNGFPEDGEEPIVCLTSHDSYRNEYVVWHAVAPDGTGKRPETLDDYEPIDDAATVSVRTFDSEEAMLDAFVTYVEATDPDILSGWNFEDFDAPYLLDRMERLDPASEFDLSIGRLSRVDEVWRSGWGGPDVKGRVVFDLLYAYKRTQFTELESYRLDAVGELELDVGKERYAGDIGDLWEEEPERLLEYNLRDVELCVEIDAKQNVVDFWDEVRRFVGCKLEDAPTPGDTVDMYVLHKAFGKFALPTKGQQESEEFEGGAVFDPITGVRENVTVLDLKSLYPMCMVTVNASPETKVGDDYDGPVYRAPNGARFRQEPDGIMREMVNELLNEREELKAARNDHDPDSEAYGRYDRQQQAVKVIMNSLYGVSGWERFRLYDKENAAAITATGREVIDFTQQVAEAELEYQIAYGDTDSIMIELGPDVSTEAAIERSFEIEERINEAYDEFARERLGADDHRFQIEFEKLYRRFFQAGKKKRYAGHIVWKEGKEVDDVDITGFEYKRSDIAPITKRVQREVIDRIVHGEELDDVKEYLHGTIAGFEDGDVDLDDVGIPGGIGKRLDAYDTDTAQVRGAKYANLLLGTNFGRGSKPKRLYLERVTPAFFDRFEAEHPDLFPDVGRSALSGAERRRRALYDEFRTDPDVICFEYADQIPEEFVVDYETMLDKTLKGPISRIIEALDLSWDEVRSGQQQTGLGSFM